LRGGRGRRVLAKAEIFVARSRANERGLTDVLMS
jgi:hypothetical protein